MKGIDLLECKEAMQSLKDRKVEIEKPKPEVKISHPVEIFKAELNQLDAEMDREYRTEPKKKETLKSLHNQRMTCDRMITKFEDWPEKLNYWKHRKQRIMFDIKILKSVNPLGANS